MDAVLDFLTSFSYGGMAVGAFIAGSVFPFSSETMLAALQLAGLKAWPLFLSATVGNVLGSMFNYWIGSMGRLEWIETYLHVKREKVESTQRWLQGRGAWMEFLCFLPVLGSALSVTLGYMRSNLWLTLLSITAGKALRYAVVIWAVKAVQT